MKRSKRGNLESGETGDIAAYCLTNYATVLDLILKFLTSKQLCAASRVCWFWNEAARRTKSKRKQILTKLMGIPEEEVNELSMDIIGDSFKSFVSNSKIFPSAAMLYMNRSDEFFGSMNHQKNIKKTVKNIFTSLPPGSPLVGCLGGGVIGCNDLLSKEFEQTESASLLLLPATEGVEINQFFLTLTEINKAGKDVGKWRDLTGLDKGLDVKCVLIHACCETEEIEKTIEMIFEIVGNETVVAGGQAESVFLNQKVRLRGISCICFSGNICTSLVVHKARNDKDDMSSCLEKLKDSVQPDNHSVMFMYSCVARGCGLYSQSNVETTWIREVLPKTPVIGMFAFGEIGYDPKNENSKAKELTMIHSYSTVLCLCRFPAT